MPPFVVSAIVYLFLRNLDEVRKILEVSKDF